MVPSTCQADGARRAEAHRRRFLLEGAAEQGAEVERLVEVVLGAAGHEPGRAAPHDLGALVEGRGDGADGDGRARSVDRRRGQPVDVVAAVVERQLLDGADRQHGRGRQHHAPHAESHPQTVSHRRSLPGPPDGPHRINVQSARSERRGSVPESASGGTWRARVSPPCHRGPSSADVWRRFYRGVRKLLRSHVLAVATGAWLIATVAGMVRFVATRGRRATPGRLR